MPDPIPSNPGVDLGQVVFIKKADTLSIPQIFQFVDSTSMTQPGFVSAFIYRHMNNPSSYSVYETRTGTRDEFLRNVDQYDLRDVLMLDRNVARDRLADVLRSSVDWYNPIARWQNRLDASKRHETSIIRVMRLKPGQEARDTVVKELSKQTEVALRFQPALMTAVLHENLDHPDMMMLYEEWTWTKEQIVAEELPKSYRTAFRKATDPFLVSRRDPEWLKPMIKLEVKYGRIEKTIL